MPEAVFIAGIVGAAAAALAILRSSVRKRSALAERLLIGAPMVVYGLGFAFLVLDTRVLWVGVVVSAALSFALARSRRWPAG